MSTVVEVRAWPSRLETVRASMPAVKQFGGDEVAEVVDAGAGVSGAFPDVFPSVGDQLGSLGPSVDVSDWRFQLLSARVERNWEADNT